MFGYRANLKLLESYRLIIDGSEAINASGVTASGARAAPPPGETLERMIQNATLGVQILESATTTIQQPTPTSEARSPKERDSEDSKEPPSTGDGAASVKRQVRGGFAVFGVGLADSGVLLNIEDG